MDEVFYSPVDPNHIKREKSKARELRQTSWWDQKLNAGICYYCEKKFGKTDLTMDHILAIGRGGHSAKGNIVAACKECNSKKAHQTPAEMLIATLSNKT